MSHILQIQRPKTLIYCVYLNSIGNTGWFASVMCGSVFGVFSERNLGCTSVRYQKLNCVDSHSSWAVCVSWSQVCAARGDCCSFEEFLLNRLLLMGLGARRELISFKKISENKVKALM